MNIKKYLLLAAVIPMTCLVVSAQNAPNEENTPQKGDFTLGLTIGYNSYASINALPGNLATYEASAINTNWADKKLMVGFEAGWFFNDLWKLNLGGGLNFSKHPGYCEVPGTIDDADDTWGEIPNYRAVADASYYSFNVYTGVDRYFNVPQVKNLVWYAGLRVGVAYAQNQEKYDEVESMGKSVAETCNLRVSAAMGVEYYVLPALYVGAQIDPLAYTYNITTYKPQEGLGKLQADSHNFSFIAAPTLKVGFKF